LYIVQYLYRLVHTIYNVEAREEDRVFFHKEFSYSLITRSLQTEIHVATFPIYSSQLVAIIEATITKVESKFKKTHVLLSFERLVC